MIYRCEQNQSIDLICHNHYGHTSGAVEVVLEQNPHLADLGVILPTGMLINLPMLPAKPVILKQFTVFDNV